MSGALLDELKPRQQGAVILSGIAVFCFALFQVETRSRTGVSDLIEARMKRERITRKRSRSGRDRSKSEPREFLQMRSRCGRELTKTGRKGCIIFLSEFVLSVIIQM